MNRFSQLENKIAIGAVVKALLFALAITFILFLILALVLFFTDISESIIPAAVFVISMISLAAGGIIASKNAQQSGFLHGALVAAGYFILVFLGSVILSGGIFFSMHLFTMAIGCLAAGMFGGIIGINTKSQKRW